MANFDYFSFMHNRRASIEPTEDEKREFNLYMSQMVLSMDTRKSVINILDKINTKEFFSLPNEIQCMAFTTFDGIALNLKWKKSKAGSQESHKEYIEKIMKVYNLSHNDAESCIRFKTINLDELDELYTRIYEPETIKFRKSKSNKKE